jgi:Tfp pilus assembly protein PilF
MTDFEKMQTELNHYKTLFGTNDVASRGYRAVVKMLEQQIEVLNNFDIKSNIDQADKKYDRAVKIFNEMPDMILALKDLKDKLGIEYVEKVERMTATTPQSIGLLKTVNR